MKEEIKIVKWIIRVNGNKSREKADLIGFDKDGNEYTFQYWDGVISEFRKQDIIKTLKNKQ
jgi:hypothetical protein